MKSFIIIFILTLLVPVVFLPNMLENAFCSPKALLILMGVSLLIAIYSTQYVRGERVLKSNASTPRWVIILILLNFMSFFYTHNYYYTKVAALMNITSLLFFYFVSIYVDGRKAFWILGAVAFGGTLVSIITYLEFTGHFPLFEWTGSDVGVTGTIGNANYLGAYLLFPLFALAGLIFLLKGKLRLLPAGLFIFVFGVFLFTRARASWLGLGISFPIFMVLIKGIYNFSVPGYIRSNPKRVMGYGILILFLVTLLWSISPQRFHSMMDIKELSNPKTLEMRMKHYQASWWLFKESPLFGTGLWSYRNRVYDAQAEINREDPEFFKDYVDCKPRRVHNEYLEILNDGGLVASAFLLIFLIVVMSHGRRVIQDRKVQMWERVITATAFASVIGIMVAAILFFPFRINSTLFMTVLMMGIMEGIYLRNYGLVTRTEGRRLAFAYLVIPLIFLVLMGIFWFGGYKPFKGELESFRYKEAFARRDAKQAEKHILKAISCDPDNSLYCYNAGQLYMNILRDYVKAGDFFERVVIDFNGDITRWSVYFMKGLLKFRMGSLFEARDAFEKSIYHNPNFSPARKKLKEVKKVLKDYDSVLIKLR